MLIDPLRVSQTKFAVAGSPRPIPTCQRQGQFSLRTREPQQCICFRRPARDLAAAPGHWTATLIVFAKLPSPFSVRYELGLIGAAWEELLTPHRADPTTLARIHPQVQAVSTVPVARQMGSVK